MILSRKDILKEIKEGTLKIAPLNKNNIGAASIDLTLGDEFRVFGPSKKYILTEKTDYHKFTRVMRKKVVLKPGDFCLGITKEIVKLPDNFFGMLGGRTTFARHGILVHATASFIQPGTNNKQVFEIKNISKNTITIKSGLKIGQLVLQRMSSDSRYKGKVQNQRKI